MVTLSITFRLPSNFEAKTADELIDSCASALFIPTKVGREVTALKVWHRIWYCPEVEAELGAICQPRARYRQWLSHIEVNSGINFHGLDTSITWPGHHFRIRERDSHWTRELQLIIEDGGTEHLEDIYYPLIHTFQSVLHPFISLAAICHIARQAEHLDGGEGPGRIAGMKKKLARIEQLCEGNYDPHVAGSTALTPQPSR